MLLVYIFPEGNQRNNFKDKAKELNEEAKAFAIGTNRHTPLSQLVDLSSKTNKESYAMQFKKPSDVIPAVKSLSKKKLHLKIVSIKKKFFFKCRVVLIVNVEIGLMI